MRRDERSDTDLVLAARADDPAAFGEIFERWFERSWNVARTVLRDDDLASDVAQDALLGAWLRLDQLQDPEAFGGWLLRSTRNRALSRLTRERRSTASGDEVVADLRDRGRSDPTGGEPLPQPEVASGLRDRQELVWAAAAALGESDASLLDLHLRHGLTPAEIAEELEVEANTAHQKLFRLRDRLGEAIASYLLWRNGSPRCEGLAGAISAAEAFDRSVARAVRKHQASCDRCSEERAALVEPSELFASVPLLVVPIGLKAEAAAALEATGVALGSTPASAGSAPTEPPSSAGDGGGGGGDVGGGGPAGANGGDVGGSGPGHGAAIPPSSPVTASANGATSTSSPATGPPVPLTDQLSIRELLLGVGAGLLTLALLFGAASLILGEGNDMGLLTGFESGPSDLPAADQSGSGNGGDPTGPASFSRDGADLSDDETAEGEPSSTTARRAGSTTSRTSPSTSLGSTSTTGTTLDTTTSTRDSTTSSATTTTTTRLTTTTTTRLTTTTTRLTTTTTTRLTTTTTRLTTTESTSTTTTTTTAPTTSSTAQSSGPTDLISPA